MAGGMSLQHFMESNKEQRDIEIRPRDVTNGLGRLSMSSPPPAHPQTPSQPHDSQPEAASPTAHSSPSSAASIFDGKNPVSLLQEFCAKSQYNVLPVYKDGPSVGPSHCPRFTIEVTVTSSQGTVKGHGTGLNKKEAKIEAAKEAYLQLTQSLKSASGDSSCDQIDSSPVLNHPVQMSQSTQGPLRSPPVHERNMVPVLNEWCQKRCILQPEYKDEARLGSDHQPLFTIRCTVKVSADKIITATGTGRDKKTAKKLAAAEVWDQLETVNNGEAVATEGTYDLSSVNVREIDTNLNLAKKAMFFRFMDSDPDVLKRMDQFMSKKRNDDEYSDCVEFLDDIAADLRLVVQYLGMNDPNKEEDFQVLVNLYYEDEIVVSAWGSDSNVHMDAKLRAAFRALLILMVLRTPCISQ